MEYKIKRENLQKTYQEKLIQLQQLEAARQQSANELLEIQGKIKLIDELIKESSTEKPCQKIETENKTND